MKCILIIEDERDLLQGLKDNLEIEGYRVLGAPSGEEGLEIALREAPDLVILDVMLPGIDGFDVCRRLRAGSVATPVIFLSAKSDEVDRVVGLEIGADDYITKPFSLRELLARIRVRLRDPGDRVGKPPPRARIGDVELDFARLTATRGGEPLALTSREFEILRLLASHRGRVVTRALILREILGYSESANTRTVDTHILNLRQKIEEDPGAPKHIQTVYGKGYRLVD